jgi:hypothetical protein
VSNQTLDQLRQAVDASAATFDRRGWGIKERWMEMALESALRALGAKPLRQLPLQLPETWTGRVGGVDLGLRDDDGATGLIELKWDQRTLAACAWDSMKLAAALYEGQGDQAFLLAGSPVREPAPRGHELLEDGTFSALDVHLRYAPEFARWNGDVQNRPKCIPAAWRIHARHSARLTRRGELWEIRIAELQLQDEQLVRLGPEN